MDKSVIPWETEEQKHNMFLLLVVLGELLLFFSYFKMKTWMAPFAVLLFILVAGAVLFSVRNTLALLFAYISFLPSYNWGNRYPFFRGLYFIEFVALGLIGVITLWLIAAYPSRNDKFNRSNSAFDYFLGFFLLLVIIDIFWGGMQDVDLSVLKTEGLFLLFYSMYFIYKRCFTGIDLAHLWRYFLLITTLVAVEYILLAASEKSASSLLMTRIVTQQPHLAQLSVPLFASLFLFTETWRRKGMAGIGLFVSLVMVFISQQRGLWVGIAISVFLVMMFYYFRQGFSIRRLGTFCLITLVSLSVFLGVVLIFDRYFAGSIILTMISRFGSLAALSMDASTNIRLSEIFRALHQWSQNTATIIWGTGLGTTYPSIDATRPYTFSVDNSYVYILWKTGLLGLIAFLGWIAIGIRHALIAFYKTKSTENKMWISGLLSGWFGLLVIGLTNTCVVRYRFILIWALLLATLEYYYCYNPDKKSEQERDRRGSLNGHREKD